MPRSRVIKPDFTTDEKLVECSIQARYLFAMLLMFLDDKGRGQYNPKRVKMQVFPADSIDVEPLLHELISVGVLRDYEVAGVHYLCAPNFLKHQSVKHPSKCTVPAPPWESAPVVVPERSGSPPVVAPIYGEERRGEERSDKNQREILSPDFDADEIVRQIASEHPGCAHLGNVLPQDLEHAIIEALARDGQDVVLAGTRNLRDAVAEWPKVELRYIPNPVKFYRGREYAKDPEVWKKTSKVATAAARDRDVIAAIEAAQ
jgi:hypothetical protein